MLSNRKVSSTAMILTLTASVLQAGFSTQMVALIAEEERRQKMYAKEEKRLTNDVFKQNKIAHEKAYDNNTSVKAENHQQPYKGHGHSRRR